MYQVAIFIDGGDVDKVLRFVPAIEMAKNEGIAVWLFHGQRPHDSLWSIADERIKFTHELVNSILWKP